MMINYSKYTNNIQEKLYVMYLLAYLVVFIPSFYPLVAPARRYNNLLISVKKWWSHKYLHISFILLLVKMYIFNGNVRKGGGD